MSIYLFFITLIIYLYLKSCVFLILDTEVLHNQSIYLFIHAFIHLFVNVIYLFVCLF